MAVTRGKQKAPHPAKAAWSAGHAVRRAKRRETSLEPGLNLA
jgi:hypothetical protein